MPSTATPSYLHLPPLAPSYKSACVPVYPLRQPEKVHYHYGANETTPQSGLRTPPAESMGTTYQVPSLGSCGDHHAHHHAPYVSALASSDRQRKAFSDAVYEPTPTHSMPNYQQQVSTQPRATQPPPSSVLPSNSRHSTTPSTPLSGPMAAADEATASRDATMVLHSLRIPACISPKGGNLADFAAQVSNFLPSVRARQERKTDSSPTRLPVFSGSNRPRPSKRLRTLENLAPRLSSSGSRRMRYPRQISRSGCRRCSLQLRSHRTLSYSHYCSYIG